MGVLEEERGNRKIGRSGREERGFFLETFPIF
jgi:hypothetical protein